MARLTATVNVRRRVDGAQDRYGTPVPSWAPPEAVDVYAVAPRAASNSTPEPGVTGRPDLLIVGLTVFAPLGTEIGAGDRVDYGGDTWEVVGLPGVWKSSPVSTGNLTNGGVIVNLEKVTG